MNSTAPLWVALISPIAALLGAALGLFGALVVSRRATRTAFRQALYSGQLSRQQEVLTTYYEHIGAMYDELLLLPTRSRQDVADREEFHQALLKATGYGKRHHIWVPVELWDKYIEMVSLLQAKQSEIMDAASDEVLTDDEYELVRERIDQWMQGEGSLPLSVSFSTYSG